MCRGFQVVEGRRINPNSPYAYLPCAVNLNTTSLRKEKHLKYALTLRRSVLNSSYDSVAFFVLNLGDDT